MSPEIRTQFDRVISSSEKNNSFQRAEQGKENWNLPKDEIKTSTEPHVEDDSNLKLSCGLSLYGWADGIHIV